MLQKNVICFLDGFLNQKKNVKILNFVIPSLLMIVSITSNQLVIENLEQKLQELRSGEFKTIQPIRMSDLNLC